jgi:hypothetical protein
MLGIGTSNNLPCSFSDSSERVLFITLSVYYNLLLIVKNQRLPCIKWNYDAITFYLVRADNQSLGDRLLQSRFFSQYP